MYQSPGPRPLPPAASPVGHAAVPRAAPPGLVLQLDVAGCQGLLLLSGRPPGPLPASDGEHGAGAAWQQLSRQITEALASLPPPGPEPGPAGAPDAAAPAAAPLEVRYYLADGSVFLDGEYLIKGVAGAIFWKLACEHARNGRCHFSTRELRLAGTELRLPDLRDNLDVRLLLLRRRLAARQAPVQIARTGRGRFCLQVQAPLHLALGQGP